MSSPYLAGSAGILRSINPLLTKANIRSLFTSNLENPPGWNTANGLGKPNVHSAAQAALGRVSGQVITNRLTPLFSMYSAQAEDHFYTTVPQVGAAAFWSIGGLGGYWKDAGYISVGPDVTGYGYFPGAGCSFSPCDPEPGASVYVFTTDRSPNGMPLVPLYRLSFNDTNPNNAYNRDTTYTTEKAGIEAFHSITPAGYELDGIEGYIYKKCTSEPSCVPAGAVRLYRRYNLDRDDFAIFPESELAFMESQGYTSTGGSSFSEVLGYVYPNVDSDGDRVIDGFEAVLGTNALRADSDCDGLADGVEILDYPYADKDPRVPPICGTLPPVARFIFTCNGLSCSFDGTGSTDDVAITSYSWTFGDSTGGSGSTTVHLYPGSGEFLATLTVTDNAGNQHATSRVISANGETPAAALRFFTVPPCRLLDTRTTGTPFLGGQQRVINVAGSCGVPATAKAVSFNVTIVSPTSAGHFIAYPGDQGSSPFSSSLINFAPGASPRANNAILRLATNGAGSIALRAILGGPTTQAHLILDVDGYFSEDTAAVPGAQGPFGFQTLTACLVADTRPTGTPLVSGEVRNFTVLGVCGVPAGTPAAALRLAVAQSTAGGHATLFKAGPVPGVSTINFIGGALIANGTRTALAASAPDVAVQYIGGTAGATNHVILSAHGYFRSDALLRYRPVTPCRLVDTRYGERGGPLALGAGETRTFQVRGNCGIPLSAKAAMLNFVAVNPPWFGYINAYPSGTPDPGIATLVYHVTEGTIANGMPVPLSTATNDLAVSVVGSGSHLTVDVYGYFQ